MRPSSRQSGSPSPARHRALADDALSAVSGGAFDEYGGSFDDYGSGGYDGFDDYGGGGTDGFDDYGDHITTFDGADDSLHANDAGTDFLDAHDGGHGYSEPSSPHDGTLHDDEVTSVGHGANDDATLTSHGTSDEHGDSGGVHDPHSTSEHAPAPYGAPDGFGGWDYSGLTAEPTAAAGAHVGDRSIARDLSTFGLHATSEAQTAIVEGALHANHVTGLAATATKGVLGAIGATVGAAIDLGEHGRPQSLSELGAFATKNALTVAAGLGGGAIGGALGNVPGAFAGGVAASVAAEPRAGQLADYLFGTHRYGGH
ncbi:MAG: hypothetical protein U0235_21760 [Polyangiaceae bacterium]